VNVRFVTRAIDATRRGLDYEPDAAPFGEFATHTGPDLNLARASLYPKSVYVSTFVIHSLTYVAADPSVARIRERAADFLEAEEEENGTWNYEGRGEWRLPADLDSSPTPPPWSRRSRAARAVHPTSTPAASRCGWKPSRPWSPSSRNPRGTGRGQCRPGRTTRRARLHERARKTSPLANGEPLRAAVRLLTGMSPASRG
jgi:hypothetical protein